MDLRVAPQADHEHVDSDSGAKGQSSARAASAEPYALFAFELRRVPRPNSKIRGDIEEVVLNRCVLAGVEVLTSAGAETEVAGTAKRPVVQARFEGADAPSVAARSAVRVLASIRQVQRAAENEFQVVGALTVGATARGSGGVRVESGGADVLLGKLRERAAPGQILLSDEARAAVADVVETVPARGAGPGAEGGDAPTHVLRGLR